MTIVIQNFYKQTITRNLSATTGDFNVSTKPTISSGYLVVSPNNTTLREIIKYTATGTNAYGDFITVSNIVDRGVGGTSAQTHTIGESIRMNITAEHWKAMNDDIASIVAAGLPAGTDGQIMVNNAGAWEAGNKLPEEQLLVKTVSISSADILTLYSSPKELIPAPGSGKVLILDQLVYSYTYGTVQYTAGGIIKPVWRGDTTAVWGTGLAGELAVAIILAASNYIGIRVQSAVSIAQRENTAIDLHAILNEFATGDGTLKVFIKYRIITL